MICLHVVEPTMFCVVCLSFIIHYVPGLDRYRLNISPRRFRRDVQHDLITKDASTHLLSGAFSDPFFFSI